MNRVGLYLNFPLSLVNVEPNPESDNLPISHNPGMGGSEYQILLLAQQLLLDTKWECCLFMPRDSISALTEVSEAIFRRCGKRIIFYEANTLDESIGSIHRAYVDVFVYISIGETIDQIKLIKNSAVPIIAWPTNADWDRGYILSRLESVKRVITVSLEQYHTFRYSTLGGKLKVINLMVPACGTSSLEALIRSSPQKEQLMPDIQKSAPIVGFMGALTKHKGIFEFINIAKELLNHGITCQFSVFGASNLYDACRGHDVISPDILKLVRHYKLDSYIDFHAIVGKKIDSLARCDIAISNPTGIEEFCLSAVEFNQAGVPVLCPPVKGYKTSMQLGNTAFGCTTLEEYVAAARRIFSLSMSERRLLRENCILNSMRFDPASIVKQWDLVLSAVVDSNNKKLHD